MARRYDEPVEVLRRDELPVEFLWRGRMFLVRDIFACWVETDPWWRKGLSADLSEREMWRVEASGGRTSATGVFDLSFDWSAGSWQLAQVLD